MSEYCNLKISVIIPTKNGGKYIDVLLNSINNQVNFRNLEIILVDSGSTDSTLKILSNYPNIKLFQIKPEEFGHGKTRNFGARYGTGDFLVFINQDAVPADVNWLKELIDPLLDNDEIGCTFSRHLPQKDCYLFMQRDLISTMGHNDRVISCFNKTNYMIFSTVSCVIKKEIWEEYFFEEDIDIAEDQRFGEKVLKGNYKIFYASKSKVYHSHNYQIKEFYQIKKRVGTCICRFKNRLSAMFLGFSQIFGSIIIKLIKDFIFIFNYKNKSKNKTEEILIAFKFRLVGFCGKYIGWISSFKKK